MIDLNSALCYDIETLPNVFTLNCVGLFSDVDMTFEISDRGRDDRHAMLAWFDYWQANQTPLIGFNNIGFDYPVLHFIFNYQTVTVAEIYEYAMSLINSHDRFGNTIWPDDRFAPQIDLFRLMHFDNRAKATSLKALQVNMRADSVMEMPIPFDRPLTREQIDQYLIPYNKHDVHSTKKFALLIQDAIKFRIGLMTTLRGDVVNYSDGKIGRSIIQQRLGISSKIATTKRDRIALNDIIFPYVRFHHPEFNRILNWMRTQTITEDEITGQLKTKGVFNDVKATVGGLEFEFGTGGIHASLEDVIISSDAEYMIRDIDVAALYPNIAIKNRLYPEHLGEQFVDVYAQIPEERNQYKKGTGENSALKLASNVPYGDSNNKYSFMFDPRYTMQTTINGQLMLCMLAEHLVAIPTVQLLQANTDGITYRIRRDYLLHAQHIEKCWESLTLLTLESAEYKRMWLKNVNNYIAEDTKGKLKMKGCYWFPRVFPDDITNAVPPAWHKDFSNIVSTRAAVEHMVTGVDIERFIYSQTDPFEFMLRAKVDRSSQLWIGDKQTQRICRYYMTTNGAPMKKVSPPTGVPGTWKRKNGISDTLWRDVLAEVGSEWDQRIHTANRSKYETREMSIQSGYLVSECNRASDFDWQRVDYQYYVDAAKKLVIG